MPETAAPKIESAPEAKPVLSPAVLAERERFRAIVDEVAADMKKSMRGGTHPAGVPEAMRRTILARLEKP